MTIPTCHPDRKHCARGLCRTCWERQRVRDPKERAKSNKKWRETHKDSRREYDRRWVAANTEKARERQKRSQLRRDFGITLEAYKAMLEEQGGVCKLCRGSNKSGVALHVDHCHETGAVRQLLCLRCNFALGWAEEHGPDGLARLGEMLGAAIELRQRRGAA